LLSEASERFLKLIGTDIERSGSDIDEDSLEGKHIYLLKIILLLEKQEKKENTPKKSKKEIEVENKLANK
jgi:hypothetical protein